ncbi:DUF1351 domain-containing protein [Loigolactobacillus jiayinensis]|uniref:DUF1351 domain-containing protein n=1 Tax=Loigolactobacillus jiayinensis TaxID=2486016 RepID=A0ABW1RD21_9LACO|nr:DUF1351 domain-containing protein [Loigolactobacillus jiayinensis]
MNELTASEQLDFSVEYKPTLITINNQDKLDQAIDDYISHYEKLVVTEQTLADDKKVKQSLNSLKKQLNSKRIEIHKKFDQPYTDFKAEIDNMIGRIEQVINPIDQGIAKFEEQQKKQRLDEVKALITEMAPNYHVDPGEIEIDESWLTKSLSKKKRLDAIAGAMTLKAQDKKRLAEGIAAVTNYAELLKIDVAGWIAQLKQGQDLSYLQEQMKRAAEEKAKKAEYEQAMTKLKTEQQGNKIVDTSTGEIVEETHTRVVKITCTKKQMWHLYEFMINNEITAETVVMK